MSSTGMTIEQSMFMAQVNEIVTQVNASCKDTLMRFPEIADVIEKFIANDDIRYIKFCEISGQLVTILVSPKHAEFLLIDEKDVYSSDDVATAVDVTTDIDGFVAQVMTYGTVTTNLSSISINTMKILQISNHGSWFSNTLVSKPKMIAMKKAGITSQDLDAGTYRTIMSMMVLKELCKQIKTGLSAKNVAEVKRLMILFEKLE